MDEKVLACFVIAAQQTFKKMCNIDSQPGKAVWGECETQEGVSAIITFQGHTNGAAVLSMPDATALALIHAFTGMEMTQVDEDVVDGVQEMINIIVGAAKANMANFGLSFKFGLPSLVVGKVCHRQQENKEMVRVPFACSLGSFLLVISMEVKAAG